MSAFSLLIPPTNLAVSLRRLTERFATTYTKVYIRSFGLWLDLRYIFGAGRLI